MMMDEQHMKNKGMIGQSLMNRPWGLLLLALLLWTCGQKTGAYEAATTEGVVTSDTWAPMDDFHLIMAECFHPFKDSANLEPAIKNAGAMAAAAEQWLKAPLPAKLDNEEIRTALRNLKQGADALAVETGTGNEAAIGASLTRLHDIFHELQEAWYSRPGENPGHEH
jgi:hypothetical protein